MDQNIYIKQVIRKLNCSGKKKKEIAKQLQSDIGIALEEGKTLEEILDDMGSPAGLAEEFNENMPPEEQRKAGKAFAAKIAAAVLAVLAAAGVLLCLWLQKMGATENKGSFDEAQITERVKAIVELIDEGDYGTLRESYADPAMYEYITEETMEAAKNQIGGDWGAFVSLGDVYLTEVSQQGGSYMIAQPCVVYENVEVVYTITFGEDQKIIGLYMNCF